MDQQQTQFTRRIGDGWLFFQTGREDTFIFQGPLKLPEGIAKMLKVENKSDPGVVRVTARLNRNEHKYEVTLDEYGTWKPLAKTEMPEIGDNPFVETTLPIPLDEPIEWEGTRITHRKVKVRAYRDSKRRRVLRFQLPDALAAERESHVDGNDVPM